MPISVFGELPDGRPVQRVVLGEPPGPVLHLLDLGATVHRLEVTCGDGARRNVVLGHAAPSDYLQSTDFVGGTVGRYANRIAGGRFVLDGREVEVDTNDRGNHLHGGSDGFHRRLWTVEESSATHALLSLVSPDGDQGYPGTLRATARFEVTAGMVRLELEARTDAPTLANLTSHAYFNLDGDGCGTIDEHLLLVRAGLVTPVDETGIPLGGHCDVTGTVFDLRRPTRLGAVVRSGDEQLSAGRGLDHNYVLDGDGRRRAAVLESPRTGTRLVLSTDQPGLQVYTGNFLDGSRRSAEGTRYRQGDGIALEPQRFPDSPNQPGYPSSVLRPSGTYRAVSEWAFEAFRPARSASKE